MLALLMSALVFVPGQEPEPGISRALAATRRQQIRDVEYDIRLAIGRGAKEALGEIWIRFHLDEEPSGPLVLDFGGTGLDDLEVNTQETGVRLAHDHVLIPADLLAEGANGITARFRTPIAPTGTPLTVYRDPTDGREYCYTLVVPADAHLLFPCFDQPDLRARLRLDLDLPDDWVAVANARPAPDGVAASDHGRLWKFAQTPPLPTYLMAFACGPFDVIEGPLPSVRGIEPGANLRLFARPSQRERVDAAELFALHDRGLNWIERTFGIAYPFDKLDVVLVPGFPYGGMEHAGAIFYREASLAFDHPPTAAELVRRSTLIYHELSHQWFGNLVTMKWFDDLWLKEGFATFVSYQALEALEPERQAWLRFLQRVEPRAYEVDGTPGTTPIYQELDNLSDAKSAYGAIVYNKAPAVLRELHDRIGDEAFRNGLSFFLKQHAFGNADWRDLASALEAASHESLEHWSDRWLLSPSMPQVRIEWETDDEGRVERAELRQRAVDGSDGVWPLRLEILVFEHDGSTRLLRVESDATTTELPELVGHTAPLAILANPRDSAYGQFVPDPASARWLLSHTAEIGDPLQRAVALSALFEGVREAEIDPLAFAGTSLSVLTVESDPDSYSWLLSRLGTCLRRYLTPKRAEPILARTVDLLLGELGDGRDSGRELSIFRFLAYTSSAEEVLALCREVVRGTDSYAGLHAGKRDRFLAAAALIAQGAIGDDLERLQAAFAGQDVQKELFLAGAAAPDPKVKESYWRQYMQLDHPPEQWTQDSLARFHWPGQEELTLPYLRKALDKVGWVKKNRRIFFMPAWIDAFVNGHDSPEALAIVDSFLAGAELDGDVRRKILQSRDGLRRTVRIRDAFATSPGR